MTKLIFTASSLFLMLVLTGSWVRAGEVVTLEVYLEGGYYSCVLAEDQAKVTAESLCWNTCLSQTHLTGRLWWDCNSQCGGSTANILSEDALPATVVPYDTTKQVGTPPGKTKAGTDETAGSTPVEGDSKK